MKNIIKIISGIAFAFLLVLAGAPSVAKAETSVSGRSEFEIKIITQVCNQFPQAWRDSSELCRSILAPAPAPSDTTAPTISGIKVKTIRATSAEIMWQTNEVTKGGKVFYSTTSGFNANEAGMAYINERSEEYHRGHRTGFFNLVPNTTYYYVIRVVDPSGNVTMSPQGSFKTLAMGKNDKTAPLISNITVTAIGDTSAKITWDTNESTTALLWYNTSEGSRKNNTPIFHSEWNNKHEVQLTGLAKGTTYYFVVGGTDKAGNNAEEKTGTFSTTNTVQVNTQLSL